jgi:lipopolysaccharide heptosyltransferase I
VRVLIVKLSSLGDVIHTLPALTALRRHWPDAHLTWLVEPAAAEILHGHPALNRVLVLPRRAWLDLLRRGRLVRAARQVLQFMRELRATSYDLVLDFQGLAKSAVWVAAARATTKLGPGPGRRRNELAWLAYDRRAPLPDPGAHAVERNLALLNALGVPRGPVRYDLPVAPEAEQAAAELLAGVGLVAGAAFVAACPQTRWPTKNWTATGFTAVADALAGRGLPVVFTGAPADRAALDEIAAAMRTPMRRLDGRTPLPVLAAVFRRARAVLATDTGPLHLAVAAGTPVVALFGPTDPGYTGPYGPGHLVLRCAVPCSPCFQRTCRTRVVEPHACMRRLDAAAVVEAIVHLVAREKPERSEN